MSLVLVDGMAAVRTGLAAPVLGLAVVLPVAVSKAVALIGRGAYAKYLTVDAARKLEAKGDKCIIMGLK